MIIIGRRMKDESGRYYLYITENGNTSKTYAYGDPEDPKYESKVRSQYESMVASYKKYNTNVIVEEDE